MLKAGVIAFKITSCHKINLVKSVIILVTLVKILSITVVPYAISIYQFYKVFAFIIVHFINKFKLHFLVKSYNSLNDGKQMLALFNIIKNAGP